MISVRLRYSSFHDVLPPLHGCLQYVVPDNLVPLVSAVVGQNMKQDKRFVGYNPQFDRLQDAVSRMEAVIANDVEWFSKTHCRRALAQERPARRQPVRHDVFEECDVVSIHEPNEAECSSAQGIQTNDEVQTEDDRVYVKPSRYFDVNAPESGVFDDASLGTEGTSTGEPSERQLREPPRLAVKPEPRRSDPAYDPEESGVLLSGSHPLLTVGPVKDPSGTLAVAKYASRDDSNNDSGFLETKSESDLRMISAS